MKQQDKLDEYLQILSLPWLRENYLNEAERAVRGKLSYKDFLLNAMSQEVISKIDRSVNRRLQTSGFPSIKKLEDFDFSFQPQLNEKLIRELANLDFLTEAKNLLFLGPPGVGKTHLAIAFGVKACSQRKRVAFFTAEGIVKYLAESEVAGQYNKVISTLSKIDLLIIDELGYIDLTQKTAELFFRLIASRYERKSMIITSNKAFEEWGQIFHDDVVASAILDRLLHHSHYFFIHGKSYRMKNLLKN